MAEYSDSLVLHSDNDGFVSFNCPYCSQRFKLTVSEVQDDTVSSLYCPTCGLSSKSINFMSDEAREAAQIIAENLARTMMNDLMEDFGKGFKKSKYVKFTPGKPLKMEPEKMVVEDNNFDIVELLCCRKSVRVRLLEKIIGVYCPYCGLVNL